MATYREESGERGAGETRKPRREGRRVVAVGGGGVVVACCGSCCCFGAASAAGAGAGGLVAITNLNRSRERKQESAAVRRDFMFLAVGVFFLSLYSRDRRNGEKNKEKNLVERRKPEFSTERKEKKRKHSLVFLFSLPLPRSFSFSRDDALWSSPSPLETEHISGNALKKNEQQQWRPRWEQQR